MKNILLFSLGVLISASIISSVHVVQGLVLNNWSGVHPFYRFFQLPIIVSVGIFLGFVVLTIIHLFKFKRIGKPSGFFKFGLILGTIGISSLIHPVINFEYFDWLVIFIVFIISFLFAIRKEKTE
jgi:hypothetical protein